MRWYGLVCICFLAIAQGDLASAFALTNGFVAFGCRWNQARSVEIGGSKLGVLGVSAVATAVVRPAVQDKISKWKRRAENHFSVPRTSLDIDLLKVGLFFVYKSHDTEHIPQRQMSPAVQDTLNRWNLCTVADQSNLPAAAAAAAFITPPTASTFAPSAILAQVRQRMAPAAPHHRSAASLRKRNPAP